MINQSFSRREFVRLLTGGTAAVLISFNTACKNKISRWRYLKEQEISLLDAIVEQIIPTDDFPGGKWANVSNFIDKQLDSYYRKHQLAYREGLAAFEKTVFQMKSKNLKNFLLLNKQLYLKRWKQENSPGNIGRITHQPVSLT